MKKGKRKEKVRKRRSHNNVIPVLFSTSSLHESAYNIPHYY
jgi:hypothetical protein